MKKKDTTRKITDAGVSLKVKMTQCILGAILDDINELQNSGVEVACADGKERTIHPYLIGCINDTRALPTGACNVQPPAVNHSCIQCHVVGKRIGRDGYYPGGIRFLLRLIERAKEKKKELQEEGGDVTNLAAKILKWEKTREKWDRYLPEEPRITSFCITKNDAHTRRQMLLVESEIKQAKTNKARKDLENQYGFKLRSVFSLKTREKVFDFVRHQRVDLAHNVASVIKQMIVLLVEPKSKKRLTQEYGRRGKEGPFRDYWILSRRDLATAKQIIRDLRIPNHDQLATVDVFGGKGLKIGEYLALLQHDVLLYIVSSCKDLDAKVKVALMQLLQAMKPMLAHKISKASLPELHENMVRAITTAETMLPYWFCTSVLHTMLHVFQPEVGYVACLGPPRATWMLAIERWNSQASRLITSRKNVSVNFLKKLSALYAVRHIEAKEAEWMADRNRMWLSGKVGGNDECFSITPSTAGSDVMKRVAFKGVFFAPYKSKRGSSTPDYAHALIDDPNSRKRQLVRISKLYRVKKQSGEGGYTYMATVLITSEDGTELNDFAQAAGFRRAILTPDVKEVNVSTFVPVNPVIFEEIRNPGTGRTSDSTSLVYM